MSSYTNGNTSGNTNNTNNTNFLDQMLHLLDPENKIRKSVDDNYKLKMEEGIEKVKNMITQLSGLPDITDFTDPIKSGQTPQQLADYINRVLNSVQNTNTTDTNTNTDSTTATTNTNTTDTNTATTDTNTNTATTDTNTNTDTNTATTNTNTDTANTNTDTNTATTNTNTDTANTNTATTNTDSTDTNTATTDTNTNTATTDTNTNTNTTDTNTNTDSTNTNTTDTNTTDTNLVQKLLGLFDPENKLSQLVNVYKTEINEENKKFLTMIGERIKSSEQTSDGNNEGESREQKEFKCENDPCMIAKQVATCLSEALNGGTNNETSPVFKFYMDLFNNTKNTNTNSTTTDTTTSTNTNTTTTSDSNTNTNTNSNFDTTTSTDMQRIFTELQNIQDKLYEIQMDITFLKTRV